MITNGLKCSKWAIPGLVILSFQQLTVKMWIIKFCRWLDSNRGYLVSKAIALPTEPQPLAESYKRVSLCQIHPDGIFLNRFYLTSPTPPVSFLSHQLLSHSHVPTYLPRYTYLLTQPYLPTLSISHTHMLHSIMVVWHTCLESPLLF